MHLELQAGEAIRKLNVRHEDHTWRIDEDGAALPVDILTANGETVDLLVDGVRKRAYVARRGTERLVFMDGVVHALRLPNDEDGDVPDDMGDMSPNLTAKMPGTVVKVMVSEGDEVSAGDPLVIMEAMKMETEIVSPLDGRVAKVHIAEVQVLAAGDPLLDLAPAAPDED
ncbi:biotin/lipoyl-binding protein [bacterium]|nr:biotin/lipoyl-binding protein [bacterium]